MVARSPLLAVAVTGSDVNRFWEKVDKSGDCWTWTACGRGNGYGCMKIAGRVCDVHRLAWLIHFGDIASGLLVCHKCDNRICVRPDHLFLGTSKDNVRDMIDKGRDSTRPVGERCHKAKATTEIVSVIRTLALDTTLSYTDIGKIVGLERTTVAQIARGRSWKHVDTPSVIRRPQPATV